MNPSTLSNSISKHRSHTATPSGETPAPLHDVSTLRRLAGRLRFTLRTSGVEAFARLGFVFASASLDLGLGRLLDGRENGERTRRRRDIRLGRSAEALASALGNLKGAYAKAGQFASIRHDLLPDRASRALGSLQDRVPPLHFDVIRAKVEAELGQPLEQVFAEFDPIPLGAASVAQVHRATLPDGRQVAVKVQYPWLESSLPSDIRVLRRVVRWIERWAGRELPDREGVLQEFAEGLAEELDFTREADVAEEIAANLADDARIVVPQIVRSLSTRTLLTMEFFDALPMSDPDRLRQAGVEPRDILEILGRAYAKQVFQDGLFHADPHPGNLFVLTGNPSRVLFVDFGLSKRLDPELRRQMRLGIYAVIQKDVPAFVERMDAMGMIAPGAHDGVRAAVEAMFDRISAQGGNAGALGLAGAQILGLKDEAKALLQETPGLQLPNSLLLYAKTLSYLFALGDQLDPNVDLVKISLPYLLKFLASKD